MTIKDLEEPHKPTRAHAERDHTQCLYTGVHGRCPAPVHVIRRYEQREIERADGTKRIVVGVGYCRWHHEHIGDPAHCDRLTEGMLGRLEEQDWRDAARREWGRKNLNHPIHGPALRASRNIGNAEDRADLLAYLRSATAGVGTTPYDKRQAHESATCAT